MNIADRFRRPGRLAAAAFVLLLTVAVQNAGAAVTEGKEYKTLKPAQPTLTTPAAGRVEVAEVFWYACGHCYLLEPSIENWVRKGKPAHVDVVRLPATWNEVLKLHARAFYTAELLGKLPQLHPEIFREINVRGNRLETAEKVEAFFVSKGVSKADFQKAFASFAVESKLRRAEDLNRRYRITSTPTVVVQGRYVTDAGMAGSEQRLFEVINELAAMAKANPAG